MADLQKLSPTHEQIMNWLLLNPDKSMRECADAFGYTQSWLSQLVHSDLFQAALAERQRELRSRVAASIPQKLKAVADIALDKLADAVEKSEDKAFLLEVADKTLHRLGYAPASARAPVGGPPSGPLIQQNNLLITAGDLEQARALMQQTPVVLPQAAPLDALESTATLVPNEDAPAA